MPLRTARILTALAAVAAASSGLVGCSSSTDDGTHYWKATFEGGAFSYVSTTIADGQIAGEWTTPAVPGVPPQIVHYTGLENADKTFSTSVYTDAVFRFNGDEIDATNDESTIHLHSISQTEFDNAVK